LTKPRLPKGARSVLDQLDTDGDRVTLSVDGRITAAVCGAASFRPRTVK